MHDHFSVAARPETVAQILELLHQLKVVIDLAIEDDAHGAVFIEQRLSARGGR